MILAELYTTKIILDIIDEKTMLKIYKEYEQKQVNQYFVT